MNPSAASTFDDQYDALRRRCGVVQLADWSSVTLAGNDRQTFLNNFCTNDVKRLVPGESCEAFVTNVKGKIVGHGLVQCLESELVLLGVPDQAPRLIQHLERYVIRENVVIRDTTPDRNYVLLAGGDPARACLVDRIAALWNLVGSDFAVLIEVSPIERSAFVGALLERGCVAVESQAFHAARIEAGVPLLGLDFDERNFPQEVGRDEQAISFTKGCYLGQETVARIDAMGHVNQRLAGVRFFGAEVPAVGAALTHDGKTVGHVTSATQSPKLGAPLALAMVRREHTAIGTGLDSPVGACEVLAPLV